MNLGSPDSPSVPDVRKYLTEFLMDGRVIDKPYVMRSLLVKGIITPFRAPKSAEAYASIWSPEGSPLVEITRQLTRALQSVRPEPVVMAMRYGNPSMKAAYDELAGQHPDLEKVVLVPLYPHYAMSSYETAVEHAKEVHHQGRYPFNIDFVPPFFADEGYIDALAASIRQYHKPGVHLLFSYHSIPERHIHKSDVTGSHCLQVADCCHVPSEAHPYCYRHQCLTTTRLVVAKLGLSAADYSVSFQSKLGRSKWLTPATTARLAEMPKKGVKRLSVVCPAFVSDCLETLEEVAIRERANFMESGGEEYTFIPCMNTASDWVRALSNLIVTCRKQ